MDLIRVLVGEDQDDSLAMLDHPLNRVEYKAPSEQVDAPLLERHEPIELQVDYIHQGPPI